MPSPRTSEALDLIRREAAQPARAADTQWRVLSSCFLDVINSPDAVREWKGVLERFPDDTQAYLLAIQSRSLRADPELMGRVADRLDVLSGSRGVKAPINVRMAPRAGARLRP